MKNLIKAVVQAIKDIQDSGGVDKNSCVGVGNSSYKGIRDADVKNVVGRAMASNGLAIFRTAIEDDVRIERWEESTNYGKKQKQQVFCKIKTTYLLCHESGESQEIISSGHGIDSQDKAIGKAMTYALKYALLETFLVETEHIDDTDKTHSDNIEIPENKPAGLSPQKPKITRDKLLDVILWAKKGGKTLQDIAKHYNFSENQKAVIVEAMAEDNFIPAYNIVLKSIKTETWDEMTQEGFEVLQISETLQKLLKSVK